MRRLMMFTAGLGALALGVVSATQAFADLQVIESNVSAYVVGSVVPDDTTFYLNAGDRVQVLLLPSKATRVFEGKGAHKLPRGGSRSVTQKKKQE